MSIHFVLGLLFAVTLQVTIIKADTFDLARSGDSFGGKKLLSYPTLVSILKARNASRPILSQATAPQIIGMEPLVVSSSQVGPSNSLSAVASSMQSQSPVPVAPESGPPTPEVHTCTPVSQEKNGLITKLCAGRRSMSNELANSDPPNRCLQRYCVTIIPGDAVTDDEDDEMLQTSYGNDIVAYTDCNAVNGLFRVLVRSAVTPKCYDCGS